MKNVTIHKFVDYVIKCVESNFLHNSNDTDLDSSNGKHIS